MKRYYLAAVFFIGVSGLFISRARAVDIVYDHPQRPDLTVGSLRLVAANTIAFSVWNTSSAAAGRFITSIKNLATGEEITSSDVIYSSFYPQVDKVIQFTKPFTGDTDVIRVVADPDNTVTEANESNNSVESAVGGNGGTTPALGVRSKESGQLYRFYGNRLLWVPNMATLNILGAKESDLVEMEADQIVLYPRVRHVRTKEDGPIYYVTETHLVRQLPSKSVFESYQTNHQEDIVTISQEALNAFDSSKFIRQENDHEHVYVLDGQGNKQLIGSSAAMARLRPIQWLIAPTNAFEFQSYKTGEAVLQ